MHAWLTDEAYAPVGQQHAVDPRAYERTNSINVLDSHSPATGVRR